MEQLKKKILSNRKAMLISGLKTATTEELKDLYEWCDTNSIMYLHRTLNLPYNGIFVVNPLKHYTYSECRRLGITNMKAGGKL